MARVKRRYHSDVRRASARGTREAIVTAARRLFATRGYVATPIDAIAREAGVAVQTVYAVFGSKRAMLLAMLDTMDDQADVGAVRDAMANGSATAQRKAIARFFGRLFTRGGDVIEAARAAGAADRELAALTAKGVARHRTFARGVVNGWSRAGLLRRGLSPRDASDALAAISSYSVFAELRASGWSVSRYERWLYEAIGRLLL